MFIGSKNEAARRFFPKDVSAPTANQKKGVGNNRTSCIKVAAFSLNCSFDLNKKLTVPIEEKWATE